MALAALVLEGETVNAPQVIGLIAVLAALTALVREH